MDEDKTVSKLIESQHLQSERNRAAGLAVNNLGKAVDSFQDGIEILFKKETIINKSLFHQMIDLELRMTLDQTKNNFKFFELFSHQTLEKFIPLYHYTTAGTTNINF